MNLLGSGPTASTSEAVSIHVGSISVAQGATLILALGPSPVHGGSSTIDIRPADAGGV